jgi:hypothetical protein
VGRPARARTRAGRCKGPPNAAASGRFVRSLHSSSRGAGGRPTEGGTASGRVLGVTGTIMITPPPGQGAARHAPSCCRAARRLAQIPTFAGLQLVAQWAAPGESQLIEYRRAWRPPPGRTLAPRPMHPRARPGRENRRVRSLRSVYSWARHGPSRAPAWTEPCTKHGAANTALPAFY